MAAGVFVLTEGGDLVELTEEPYDSERLLQELLATHPQLLPGDQIDPASPRRWLLVTREAGVPSSADGPNRWSVDHLFLDQEGLPTLVEVKRSTDTRIRREVVGQLLEYAANAAVNWPVDTIRARFEARCEANSDDPAEVLSDFLGPDGSPDAFWDDVQTNLEAGRLRLLFVADAIPAELRRIVEYLNAQMTRTEVLAVEIRKFEGAGLSGLVPRVYGLTTQSETTKRRRAAQGHWDEESLLARMTENAPETTVAAARRLLAWAEQQDLALWWGQGAERGSVVPILKLAGENYFLFSLWTSGTVQVPFRHMANRTLSSEERCAELLRRLNALPGVTLPTDALIRQPNLSLGDLVARDSVEPFLDAFTWFIADIRSAAEG